MNEVVTQKQAKATFLDISTTAAASFGCEAPVQMSKTPTAAAMSEVLVKGLQENHLKKDQKEEAATIFATRPPQAAMATQESAKNLQKKQIVLTD